MRNWAPLALPLALLPLLVLALALCPGSDQWAQHRAFLLIPYVLFAAAFLLGAFFGQSRVCFIAMLTAATTLLAHYSLFLKPDMVRGETVVLLATIYLPALAALFYRLDERGLLTLGGGIRGLAIVLSSLLVLALLPRIQALNESAAGPALSALRRAPGGAVPPAGMLAFLLCAPFLIVPRQHESPLLGPILCFSLLFAFVGLGCCARAWRPAQQPAVLLTFMAAAALTQAWAVMESSWRSANLDELTQLPGRRALKLHLERLGQSYAIAVADLDRFKKINDRYGHDVGDQVLRFAASRLRRIRAGAAYRHGGEEFAVVCEGAPFDGFVAALEEVRLAIGGREFGVRRKTRPRRKPEEGAPDRDGGAVENVTVTLSFGVAQSGRPYGSPYDVMEAADRALYRAKREGRNCLRVAPVEDV
jgi:GGDEF domain-containing protein